MSRHLLATVMLVSLFADAVSSQGKKDDKKPEPRIQLVLPLALRPGAEEKLTIRGANLEGAKEVRFVDVEAEVAIESKGKAAVPDKNPEKVGDTQVVVKVKL